MLFAMVKSPISMLMLMCLCLASSFQAGAVEAEIKNVFIDETISYDGHEFFRVFVETLSQDSDFKFTTLVVKEAQGEKSGSDITVEYEYDDIYQVTIYTGSKYVEQNAVQAAYAVKNKVDFFAFSQLSANPDLAASEL